MSNVVVLRDYIKEKRSSYAGGSGPEPPLIRDRDVWGRDFSVLDNVIFAILKVREILLFHLDTEEEWTPLLLWFLDECAKARSGEKSNLADAAKDMKNYVAFEMDPWNAKEMRAALMLLDLIEKTIDRHK